MRNRPVKQIEIFIIQIWILILLAVWGFCGCSSETKNQRYQPLFKKTPINKIQFKQVVKNVSRGTFLISNSKIRNIKNNL